MLVMLGNGVFIIVAVDDFMGGDAIGAFAGIVSRRPFDGGIVAVSERWPEDSSRARAGSVRIDFVTLRLFVGFADMIEEELFSGWRGLFSPAARQETNRRHARRLVMRKRLMENVRGSRNSAA